MSELTTIVAFTVPALPLAGGLLVQLAPSPRSQDWVNRVAAALTAAVAFGAAGLALAGGSQSGNGNWITLDALAGPFLAIIALVGLGSALVSPAYLRTSHRSFFRPARARGWYYLCFYVFWAALLAIPLAGNLGVAWIIIEATTGVSALLVAYNGRPRALEAGWKYLILTTAGLTVALLGIVVIYAGLPERSAGLGGLSWRGLAAVGSAMPGSATLIGFVLLFCGLATKVGWAPVHNWLPDAHSEAPPPISALLSAALLPTVMLVVWRAQRALAPAVGVHVGRNIFIAFGLASLAVAVPFLWRPMAWKRLLAYSSLEHMGVLALGIGFGNPVAIAGVVLHLSGHAVAKSLGFYAATPLFDLRPSARLHPARGLLQENPELAAGMSLSLGSLCGLPPSPLFFSEVLILIGGFTSGNAASAAIAALLLALGFLGLAHVLVQDLLGSSRRPRRNDLSGGRGVSALSIVAVVLLVALAALTFVLPGSALVHTLAGVMP
jgi:hydrogenase-4 component F